jgi:hypothetical protein
MDLSTRLLTAFSSRGICVFVCFCVPCFLVYVHYFFTGRSFFSAPISPSQKKNRGSPKAGKWEPWHKRARGADESRALPVPHGKPQRGGMRAQKVTLDCNLYRLIEKGDRARDRRRAEEGPKKDRRREPVFRFEFYVNLTSKAQTVV